MLSSTDPRIDRAGRIGVINPDVPVAQPHPDLGTQLLALGIDEVRFKSMDARSSTLMKIRQESGECDLYVIAFTTAYCVVGVKQTEQNRGRELPTFDRPFSGVIEIETNNHDRAIEIGQRMHSEDGITLRVRPDRMYRSANGGIPVVPFSVVDDPIEVA